VKGRLEAFSDGVFAIAITLLVLEIKVPAHGDSLVPALLGLWPSYAAYVVSFLAVGIWWMAHHIVTHYLVRLDGGSLFLNLLLLMTIAFIPFPTAVLADRIGRPDEASPAAVFYGLAMALPALAVLALLSYSRRSGHLRVEDYDREVPAAIARHGWIGAAINLMGIAAALVAPLVALAIFAAASVFWGVVTARWRPAAAT